MVMPRNPRKERIQSVCMLVLLATGWQVLSVLYRVETEPGVPMIAGWQILFTKTFLSLSNYWDGGFGVPSVQDGAAPGYEAAWLALAFHSSVTLGRWLAGVLLGCAAGVLLGLIVSSSKLAKRLIELPIELVRALPLLAMVPLFQLWFGGGLAGQTIFVAYGVAVVMFAGTINAVANIPDIFIQNARALGANGISLYTSVMLPGILPELRATLLLSLGVAWGAVLGAEYLGAQSGLGFIIIYAQQFGYLDRMFLISLVFVVITAVSTKLIGYLTRRLLAWAPESQRG
jgi:sulfonate transport system permease protein